MKLYDGIIQETEDVLSAKMPKRYSYDPRKSWKDTGSGELVMRRDAAYELGGSGHPSVNYTCATTSGRITENEILVYGPDLQEIRADVPFARILFLETKDLGEESDTEKAYESIRNLEFVRYHVYPEGYMIRVSSESKQEQVRVSRKAIRGGITFARVGADYITKYLARPEVRYVRVIFITEPALAEKLQPYADRVDAITKTLTHILDGIPTDCGSCQMKPVCDEVDGMRELHMGQKKAQ